jgi:hypothetical protein
VLHVLCISTNTPTVSADAGTNSSSVLAASGPEADGRHEAPGAIEMVTPYAIILWLYPKAGRWPGLHWLLGTRWGAQAIIMPPHYKRTFVSNLGDSPGSRLRCRLSPVVGHSIWIGRPLCIRRHVASVSHFRSITVAQITARAEPGGTNLAQCLLCRLL